MTITAKIIADSISPNGVRLTTFQLRYPRFIHAEELTHRRLNTSPEIVHAGDDSYFSVPDGLMYDQDLSRNASSSRAIPVKKMIAELRRDPAMPIYYGRNQPGMQAGEDWHAQVLAPLDVGGRFFGMTREEAWLNAMEFAIQTAQAFEYAGYHKQIVNRLLEPWAHINVVVTATNWSNFFALRSHPNAQPEIKMLSDLMQEALFDSVSFPMDYGQWHLPYILDSDWSAIRAFCKAGRITRDEPMYEEMVKWAKLVSVARCARVSYMTHDGNPSSIVQDIDLAQKLIVQTPLHASPAEHQAKPDRKISQHFVIPLDKTNADIIETGPFAWQRPELHGNLSGWIQNRKMLPNEHVEG